MIRILIAEDSSTVAMLLKAIFSAEADIEVIGTAINGKQCVEMARQLRPDLITMDIRMPEIDGFEATAAIMSSEPVPIVVISSTVNDEEMKTTFRALEAGALAVIDKPCSITHPSFGPIRDELLTVVRGMAEIKLVRRMKRSTSPALQGSAPPIAVPRIAELPCQLVAIGCSTGGPQVLRAVLSALPAGFPLPVVVVQHISLGFIGGLASWLGGLTALKVKLAEDGEKLEPGTVYIGPDDFHLTVERNNGGLVAALTSDIPVNRFRPSVTPLLESVARVCGPAAIGCILTGMGNDGAAGLLALHKARGHTFVQDEASATVWGMPGSALALGATETIVSLDDIASHLLRQVAVGSALNRESA